MFNNPLIKFLIYNSRNFKQITGTRIIKTSYVLIAGNTGPSVAQLFLYLGNRSHIARLQYP